MSLEQALHQRWSNSTSLVALLPADRVTTGRSSQDSLPRATLFRRTRRTVCRTNSGECLEEVGVEMSLRHESFDDAIAIVQQFIQDFDRAQFSLADGAEVLHLRRLKEKTTQLDDGTWQFQVEMLARIHVPAMDEP